MRLRAIVSSLFILIGVLAPTGGALAFNQRITVYASVSEMRYIYLDKSGLITKVGGNTSQNIEPQVFDENNHVVAMTDSVMQQYQQFLDDHNGKLEASKIYYINPVSVNNHPNTQTIKIESASLTLGGIQG
jgi:hypothetical protein